MASIGLSGGHSATISNWIRNARRELDEQLAKRRLYSQTHAELNGLSDRDLADIGIDRAEIEGIAREAAHGDLL